MNLRTGKVNEYEESDGRMLPVLRSGKPPCESCPKKSPENDERLRLSADNIRMMDFYHRAKSTPGFSHPLLACTVTQRNMRLIAKTLEAVEFEITKRARRKAERRKR